MSAFLRNFLQLAVRKPSSKKITRALGWLLPDRAVFSLFGDSIYLDFGPSHKTLQGALLEENKSTLPSTSNSFFNVLMNNASYFFFSFFLNCCGMFTKQVGFIISHFSCKQFCTEYSPSFFSLEVDKQKEKKKKSRFMLLRHSHGGNIRWLKRLKLRR